MGKPYTYTRYNHPMINFLSYNLSQIQRPISKSLVRISWICLCFLGVVDAIAQDHHDQRYFPPADTLVQKKLSQWQGMKFGLLMHWGPYSQWGVVESWSICPEDEDWCRRRGPYANDYFTYRKAYEDLQKTFNPVQFRPELWARAARAAGMKYAVFTTKHHDGFCMYDTKLTDYKITSTNTPFSSNPKANITKEVFEAFRNQNMWVGAYFSKPDWHCSDYWDPTFPPYDRNPNYSIDKHPEKWNRYVQYTQGQINELMSGYGPLDILWLDGGWVQPMTASSPRWGYKPVHQNIDMDKIAAESRKLQPGLIVVDRAVEGPNQNYLTPEQQIPSKLLPYPWETCMTLGNSWSYVKNEQYKSLDVVIHNLCAIVSRGGNYLLNIAPSPSGELDSAAYVRLAEIGAWMSVNGEAIYGTEPIVRESFNRAFQIVLNGNQKYIPVIPLTEVFFTQKTENGKPILYAMVSTRGFQTPLKKGTGYGLSVSMDSLQLGGKTPKHIEMLIQNYPGRKSMEWKGNAALWTFDSDQQLEVLKPQGFIYSDRGLESGNLQELERVLVLKEEDMTKVMSPVIVYKIEF